MAAIDKPRKEVQPCPRCGLKVVGTVKVVWFPTRREEWTADNHKCFPRSQ